MRVRKSDLEELKTTGQTTTSIRLQPTLSFVLQIGDVEKAVAKIEGNTVKVTLPAAAARQWMTTNQVGIEQQQPQPDGRQLQLLIEKDFPCAHRPQEDKTDTFEELADRE